MLGRPRMHRTPTRRTGRDTGGRDSIGAAPTCRAPRKGSLICVKRRWRRQEGNLVILAITESPDERLSTRSLEGLAHPSLSGASRFHLWYQREGVRAPLPTARVVDSLRTWPLALRLERLRLGWAARHARGLRQRWWYWKLRPDVVVLDDGDGGHIVPRRSQPVILARRNCEPYELSCPIREPSGWVRSLGTLPREEPVLPGWGPELRSALPELAACDIARPVVRAALAIPDHLPMVMTSGATLDLVVQLVEVVRKLNCRGIAVSGLVSIPAEDHVAFDRACRTVEQAGLHTPVYVRFSAAPVIVRAADVLIGDPSAMNDVHRVIAELDGTPVLTSVGMPPDGVVGAVEDVLAALNSTGPPPDWQASLVALAASDPNLQPERTVRLRGR